MKTIRRIFLSGLILASTQADAQWYQSGIEIENNYNTAHVGINCKGVNINANLHVRSDSDSVAVVSIFDKLSSYSGNYDITQWRIDGSTKNVVDKDGNFGIGTSTPSSALEVIGQVRGNKAVDSKHYLGKTGFGNVFNNYTAFAYHGNVNNRLNSTDYALLQQSNGTTFLNAKGGTSVYFRIGNTNDVMRMNGTGLFIGGNASTTRTLELGTDDAWKTSTTTWSIPSDRRLKTNIEEFKDGLAVVKKINAVRFKYNGKCGTIKEGGQIGIIAQEMQEIAPYTVIEFQKEVSGEDVDSFSGDKKFLRSETDSSGKKDIYEVDLLGFNPHALIFVYANAIQELDEKDSNIQEELERLNKELKARDQRIEDLENAINDIRKEINNLKGVNSESGAYNSDDPRSIFLDQNHPNPFSDKTVISYQLPENAEDPKLVIMKSGSRVKTVGINKEKGNVTVYGSDLSSGVYTYSIIVGGEILSTRKMVVAK